MYLTLCSPNNSVRKNKLPLGIKEVQHCRREIKPLEGFEGLQTLL